MIIYDELRPVPLFKPFFEASNVHHANQFRSVPTMILHETRVRKHLPPDLFYRDPACKADDNLIIVFDTHTSPRYLNWLCTRYPNKRILLWFWNPAELARIFLNVNPRVEKWCYSERDARQWGMRYNTQFFFDCLAEEAAEHVGTSSSKPQKALFIGREKGRSAQLEQLKNKLAEAGVVADFRLIPLPKRKPRSLWEKLIPYREVIDAVKDSQILIDLYADPEAGLSLRAMEALFFGKKMLTNRSLMRSEDFYDSRNIYILGEEERSLKEFLEEPFAPPDPSVRDRYLLSNWLKRFSIKESGKMASCSKYDRESYLMMVQGLERMADLYKHASAPSHWENFKQSCRQDRASAISALSIKLLRKSRSAVVSHAKDNIRLLRKVNYHPRAYLRSLRSGGHARVVPGGDIYKLQPKLSYPAERYFRDGRIAVYMAMFGDYDRILEPIIRPDNIDYYILTDRKRSEDSGWTAMDAENYIPPDILDNPILCNRWCKMHPHLLFPDYDASIYLDSNLLVVSDLTPFVSGLDSFPVAMFRHWKRNCVYQEVQTCMEGMRDTKENLTRHEERLKAQGIPEHWGLLEAPVIARMHKDERCIALMDAWWENYISGSRRDQLSLIETLWQNGILPEQLGTLGNNVYRCNLIVKNPHRLIVRKR